MSKNVEDKYASSLIPFEEMITRIDLAPWEYVVYLSGQAPWNAQSSCALFDPDETEEPDDDPEQAKFWGLKRALSVADTQDIVSNVKAQIPEPSVNDFIKAFNFYYAHDAFLEF